MKMIIAIIEDIDVNAVTGALVDADFRVTHIASTGGFLRRGSSTIFLGVEDGQVDEAMQIIHTHCTPPIEPGMKRGTIFVLKVDRFEQL